MQNSDEALPSISPVGRCKLVKMLINIEPHGIFWSTFAYLYTLTLSGHWYLKNGNEVLPNNWTATPASHTMNYWTALTDTDCLPNLPSMHVLHVFKVKQYFTIDRCALKSLCDSVRRSVRPWSVRENAHNSWTTSYILIQLCMILQELAYLLSTPDTD